jgi:hypothetical protein
MDVLILLDYLHNDLFVHSRGEPHFISRVAFIKEISSSLKEIKHSVQEAFKSSCFFNNGKQIVIKTSQFLLTHLRRRI